MIALRLVYLIENHSDELVDELLAKIEHSAHTREMRKVPADELRSRIYEI